MASEDKIMAFNVQGRSTLEKAMQEWFEGDEQGTRFVLWGPGGTGNDAGAQVRGRAGRKGGHSQDVGWCLRCRGVAWRMTTRGCLVSHACK